MTKTFYITYWASKHKKHITRQGKHDEKSRYGVAKNGTPYYVYYDLDAHGYRTATTCLLYTSPSPRDVEESRMPSSA